MLEDYLNRIQKLKEDFATLNERFSSDFLLDGLTQPNLVLWKEEEAYERSPTAMQEFAEQYWDRGSRAAVAAKLSSSDCVKTCISNPPTVTR